MGEGVDKVDLLDQFACNSATQFKEIIRLKPRLRQPEGNILVAWRVLGVRLEFGELPALELLVEAHVFSPEEADVRDLEQDHGKALEAETEGPSLAVRELALLEHAGVNDAAAEHLHPVAIVENLELEGGLSEGEVLIDPSLLHGAEQVVAQALQRLLEVVRNQLAPGRLQPFIAGHRAIADQSGVEEADTLHLVEGGEVARIDLVPAVHITSAKEGFVASLHKRRLVGRGVRAQQHVIRRGDLTAARTGNVVSIGWQAARMVVGDQEVVEALLRGDDRVQCIGNLELDAIYCLKILLDLLLDDSERVVCLLVKPPADKVGNVRRDIVTCVSSDESRHIVRGSGRCQWSARPQRPPAAADERLCHASNGATHKGRASTVRHAQA
mmetsp:Transcript_28564/g.92253  ORF Transcript_28564/g.92253 Transcript_28564/m.92253 type:complete len:384 (-) Transcript_28564:83-1234(-)